VTRYLQAIESGDWSASENLLPLVYNDLRRHAAVRMSRESAQQTLQPTALVHEAWLRVIGKGNHWNNRAHFFGAASEAMRRILIDNARRKARLRHGGHLQKIPLDGLRIPATTPEEKILLINDALEILKVQHPEKAKVVVLKYFGGHTNREIAQMLEVTERTVERHWAYAKAWLFETIRNPS
jgi:RNA polymerase sigma factor (TIGR02999 family)